MLRDSFAFLKKFFKVYPWHSVHLVAPKYQSSSGEPCYFLFFFFEPWYFGYLLGPSIDCRICQWEDPGEEILREGTFQVRSLTYWNIEREDQVVWSSFSECLLILLRHPYLWKLLSLHCQQYSLSLHVLPIQIYLQLSLLHSTLVSNDHLFGY